MMRAIAVLFLLTAAATLPQAAAAQDRESAAGQDHLPEMKETRVSLPWSELKVILDRINELSSQEKEAVQPPPRTALITRSAYTGQVDETSTRLRAELDLKVLAEEGFGTDCSSLPELVLSEKAGIVGEDIMFTSNDTPPEEFVKCRELGGVVNLDDITHLPSWTRCAACRN